MKHSVIFWYTVGNDYAVCVCVREQFIATQRGTMCTVVNAVCVCSTREHAFINRTNIQCAVQCNVAKPQIKRPPCGRNACEPR